MDRNNQIALSNGSLWEMTRRANVITFIGAGGKTTSLRQLTQEIYAAGHNVVATTTTKVYPEENFPSWQSSCCPPSAKRGLWFWYARREPENDKWVGPDRETVDAAIEANISLKGTEWARAWVIEGDGAKGRRLKCWDAHEPQIPLQTQCAVLILREELWGKTLHVEDVHRPERCPDLLGSVWNGTRLWRYVLKSPVFDARFKHMSWVVFLNGSNEMEKDRTTSSEYILKTLEALWPKVQQLDAYPSRMPLHLRIAAGDAKEGKIQWFDLW